MDIAVAIQRAMMLAMTVVMNMRMSIFFYPEILIY